MTDFAARFAITMDCLCRAVAARGGRDRSVTPLIVLLWGRLRRTAARFEALVAKYRAGTLPAPRSRPRPPKPAKQASPDDAPSPPGKPIPRLPYGRGWLHRLIPYDAAGFGSQIQHLLTDPEMAAFLKAAPQAGRLLRPLCHMMAITLSPELEPPPPALPPAPPPPDRPISPDPATEPSTGTTWPNVTPARDARAFRGAGTRDPPRKTASKQTPPHALFVTLSQRIRWRRWTS